MTTWDQKEFVARDGIEEIKGVRQLAYAGATPWHEFGQKASAADATSVARVRQLSGITWQAKTLPTYVTNPVTGEQDEVARAIVRMSDGRILGRFATPGYVVVQPDALDPALQALVDTGDARVDCIGSLRNGEVVFTTLAIGGAEVVKGDLVASYLLCSNSFDGSSSVRFGIVNERVVCQNSHRRALRAGSSQLVSIRHTGEVVTKLENAAKLIDVSCAQLRTTFGQYRAIASRPFSKDQLDKVIAKLFPAPRKLPTIDELLATSRSADQVAGLDGKGLVDSILLSQLPAKEAVEMVLENTAEVQQKAKAAIRELFDGGAKGSNIPGVAGTGWQAFNAVTEYLGTRGRTEEGIVFSSLEGDNARIGDKALDLIMQMVEVHA
jgi:phage/plasmid-like protein (TIGR03299 family)